MRIDIPPVNFPIGKAALRITVINLIDALYAQFPAHSGPVPYSLFCHGSKYGEFISQKQIVVHKNQKKVARKLPFFIFAQILSKTVTADRRMNNGNIFLCTPIPDGFTWTIASYFGALMHDAETLYGLRDRNFTILGIEITSEKDPQIWFPGNRNYVVIQITENCLNDMTGAIYQVAHEAIHCLSPKRSGSSTYLEEGLATYFAVKQCEKYRKFTMPISGAKYQQACNLVSELFSISARVKESLIAKARLRESDLSKITAKLLMEVCGSLGCSLNHSLAKELTTNFRFDLQVNSSVIS
jgi:hypothetical protein